MPLGKRYEKQEAPAAADPNAFLDFLGSLRDAVEDEARAQNDLLKPGLLQIASGIDTLADERKTLKALERT